MYQIAIVFGGRSDENEISVLTGLFVLGLIDREKFSPVPVYIHTDGKMYTSEKMRDLNVFKKGDFSSFTRIFFEGGNLYEFAARNKIKNKAGSTPRSTAATAGWAKAEGFPRCSS